MSAPKGDRVDAAAKAMRQRRFGEAIELLEARLKSSPDDLRATMRLGICHLLSRSEKTFLEIHAKVKRAIDRLAAVPEDIRRLWEQYTGLMKKVTGTALLIGGASLAGCSSKPEAPGPEAPRPVVPEAEAPKPEAPGRPVSEVAGDEARAVRATRGRGGARPNLEELVIDDIQSAHKYSGGVFKPPVELVDASQEKMTAEEIRREIARLEIQLAEAKRPLEGDTISAHRYSGGVLVAPRAVTLQIELKIKALKERLAKLEAKAVTQGAAKDDDKIQSAHRYSGGVFVAPKRKEQ